jgi:hypothetical protein
MTFQKFSLPSPVLRAAVLQIQEGDSEVADKGVLPELIRRVLVLLLLLLLYLYTATFHKYI